PSSVTSMTTPASPPSLGSRTRTVVRPAPYFREFSNKVAMTWLSAPGVASTSVAPGSVNSSSRSARSKLGSHSVACCSKISLSTTASVLPPSVLREDLSRSSTTPTRRSIWSRLAEASSSMWGSVVMSWISSSLIDNAVSGVRSWCEAFAANSRSEARRGHPFRGSGELGSNEVDLLHAGIELLRAHLPGPELFGARREVDQRGSQPPGLAARDEGGDPEGDDRGDDDEDDHLRPAPEQHAGGDRHPHLCAGGRGVLDRLEHLLRVIRHGRPGRDPPILGDDDDMQW